MNPSYLSIALRKPIALERFKKWIGLEEIDGPRNVKHLNAVDESIDGDDWRGVAVFIYEKGDKTIFEDMTGFLASFTAKQWLELAQNDDIEFVCYNDSVPYGQIIIIQKGNILKDFLHDEQEPSENRNIGKYEFANKLEINTWEDAAYYIDCEMDGIDVPDEGALWVFKAP